MKQETIPHWKLERYLLGELPPAELASITAQSQTDTLLAERIEALRRSNVELLEQYPPAWMARQLKQRRTQPSMVGLPRWMAPLALAAAALVLVPFYLVHTQAGSTGEMAVVTEEGTRIKGLSPRLEVWRKVADTAEKLNENSPAHAGDVVQLRYAVPKQCYGALLSVDGRGVVTIHLAGESSTAVPLEPGKLRTLDRSYQLDDAPAFEKFFLVTAPKDFALAPVAAALLESGSGSLRLPSGQLATTITLRKQP